MKRLVLMLFCLCLIAALASGAAASDVISYHEPGYTDPTDFAPSDDGTLLFGVTSRSWSASGFAPSTGAGRTWPPCWGSWRPSIGTCCWAGWPP